MPVQYGFPPEVETIKDQVATVPAKSLLDMLAERGPGKKDNLQETHETKVNSPLAENKSQETPSLEETPSKVETPVAKKRLVGSRASAGLPAAKKARDSKA